MNEKISNLLARRSIRSYKPEPVREEDIQTIIEAGLYAASGMGRQSPIVIAVTDRKVRDELAAMNAEIMGRPGTDPFYGAPAVLVVLADKAIPTHVYDGALMIGNMLQAAYQIGVGSCWIHRAKEEFASEYGTDLLKKLGIEGDYEGIGNVILGYPAEDPEPKPRSEGRVYFVR